MDAKQIDIDPAISQLIDQYSKLLEVDRKYIWGLPIPYLKSEVMARLTNLKESRLKAEKTGDIDIFTREDYAGLQALTQVINSLFGGNKKTENDRPKNMSGYTQIKRPNV